MQAKYATKLRAMAGHSLTLTTACGSHLMFEDWRQEKNLSILMLPQLLDGLSLQYDNSGSNVHHRNRLYIVNIANCFTDRGGSGSSG